MDLGEREPAAASNRPAPKHRSQSPSRSHENGPISGGDAPKRPGGSAALLSEEQRDPGEQSESDEVDIESPRSPGQSIDSFID